MRRLPTAWSDSFLASLGFRRKRRNKSGANRFYMRHRPQIESLEPRAMLASDVFEVTTLADTVNASDGVISLREAISLAATDGSTTDNDIIRFNESLFASGAASIMLSAASQLVVNSDLTIVGPGADLLTIARSGTTGRILAVNAGVTAKLQDIAIAGGNGVGTGGGIYNSGNLTLSEVNVHDNQASGNGGGIYTDGQLFVFNSSIDSNDTKHGGGIYADLNTGDTLRVENSTVSNNTAADGTGNGTGGGIIAKSWSTAVPINIVNSTISGNSSGWVGGIRGTYSAQINIVNCTITLNSATGFADSHGGGVGAIQSSVITLKNSIVAGNSSVQSGMNDAWRQQSWNINLTDSKNNVIGIAGNSGISNTYGDNQVGSTGSPLPAGLSALGHFGGPTKTHSLTSNSPAIDKGSNTWAADASITTDQRGFARKIDAPTGPSGEIVDVGAFEGFALVIVSTLIDEKDGDYSAGDLSLREALALSNHIVFDPQLFVAGPATITLTYDGNGNSIPDLLSSSGDLIRGPGADLLTINGGGLTRVFNTYGSTIEGVTITGGNFSGITGRNYTLRGVRVVGNSSPTNGGGISIQGRLTLIDSEVSGNTAASGGGIYHTRWNEDYYPLTIINSTISGNFATVKGGGIFSYGGDIDAALTRNRITNSTIRGNQAPTGSGVFTQQGWGPPVLTEVHSSIIVDNKSPNGTVTDWQGLNLHGSSSHNLLRQGASGAATGSTNIVLTTNEASGLMPLAFNGGPTQTHALLPNSKAIDKGRSNWTPLLATDQRGFVRSVDQMGVSDGAAGYTDIGAFELNSLVAPSADFDNDGLTDVATYDPTTRTVVIHLQSGRGINRNVSFVLPTGTWTDFKAGDFNGDQRDDLIIRNSNTNAWTLALSETTAAHLQDPIVANFTKSYVGDFDGDGAQDLAGWTGTKWQILRYLPGSGMSLVDWTLGSTFNYSGATAPIHVGDLNRDGLDDLVVKDNSNVWRVGLAQRSATGVLSLVEHNYGTWFNNFSNPAGTTLDVRAVTQKLIDEFTKVYNTIELEFYQGIMKGPNATAETKGGNDWDQAALLVKNLVAAGYSDAQIVSGRVQVPLAIAQRWVGAKSTSAVDELLAAFDMPESIVEGDVDVVGQFVTFDHAWVEVSVPTANGLDNISLDPSWKFKQYRDGIPNSVGEFDALDFFARAGTFWENGGDALAEFNARQLPLEFVEAVVTMDLRDHHTGSSLADVTYDGPIIQKTFDAVPIWEHVGTTTDQASRGTFDQIVAANDPNNLTHRVRIVVGSEGNPTSLQWQKIISAENIDSIVIENRDEYFSGSNFGLDFLVNGSQVGSRLNLSNSQRHLYVQVMAPGETVSLGSSFHTEMDKDETIAISLNAGQFTTNRIGARLEKALELEAPGADPTKHDLGDFLAYAGAKFWFDVDRSVQSIGDLTHSTRIRGVDAAIVRAGDDLDPDNFNVEDDLPFTPFHLFPAEISLDAFRIANVQSGTIESSGGFIDVSSGSIDGEACELFVYQYSALEHAVLEEVTGADGVSAIKILQRAFSKVDNEAQGGNNGIWMFEFVVVPDSVNPAIKRLRLQSRGKHEFGHVVDPTGSIDKIIWTSNSATPWTPGFTPTGTDLTNLRNKLIEELDQQPSVVDNGGYEDGPAADLANILIGQAPNVIEGQASSVLLAEGLVQIGTGSDAFTGTAYVINHPGGRLKATVLTDGVDINGGATSATFTPVTQQTGSFVNQSASEFVGTANGNVSRQDSDILFPSAGVRLDFVRNYNSQSRVETEIDAQNNVTSNVFKNVGLGIGWTHSFSDRLVIYGSPGGTTPDLIWYTSEGTRHQFAYESGYQTPHELLGDLVPFPPSGSIGSTGYVFYDRSGMEYHFKTATFDGGGNGEGEVRAVLVKKLDISGHGVIVDYDAFGRVTMVRDYYSPPGQAPFAAVDNGVAGQNGKLEFLYPVSSSVNFITGINKYTNVSGNFVKVNTSSWTYGYTQVLATGLPNGDDGWRLTSVASATDASLTSPLALQYQYQPSNASKQVRGLLKQVTEANGHYFLFDYYQNGRAARMQQSTDLNAPNDGLVTTLYNFNSIQRRTQVIDPLSRTETYIHQSNGLEVRQIHADRSSVRSEWGGVDSEFEFLLTTRTDEIGAKQSFFYWLNHPDTTSDDFKTRQLEYVSEKFFVDSSEFPINQNGQRLTADAEALTVFKKAVLLTHYDYVQPAAKPRSALPAHVWIDPDFIPAESAYDVITSLLNLSGGANIRTNYVYDTTNTWQLTRIVNDAEASTSPLVDEKKATTEYEYYSAADGVPSYMYGLVKSQTNPNGHDSDGDQIRYRMLGNADISSGTLTVRLSGFTGVSAANPLLVDAVRIDRVGDVGGGNAGVTVDTRIIDDTASASDGFSTTGSVAAVSTAESLSGLVGNDATKLTSSSSTTTWTFNNLSAGRYRVSISLVNLDPFAEQNATYLVFDGTVASGALRMMPFVSQNVATDPASQFKDSQSAFVYDAAGNIVSTTIEKLPWAATAVFDHNGNATSAKDPNQIEAISTFDIVGRKRSEKVQPAGLPAAATSTYTYDPSGQVLTMTDALGRVTAFEYKRPGRMSARINPDGSRTTFAYDAAGNLISQTDELGRTMRFVYDSRNRLIQTVYPDGANSFVRYDGTGRAIESIAPIYPEEIGSPAEAEKFQLTKAVFDAAGRQVKTINANNGSTSNKYDKLGRVVEAVDFRGIRTTFRHDRLGRVTETRVWDKDEPGNATVPTLPPITLSTTDYDDNGNVTRSVTYNVPGLIAVGVWNPASPPADPRSLLENANAKPHVHVTEMVFDTLNHPVAVILKDAQADGSGDVITRTRYDATGRVRFAVDELGRETESRYDAYGRLIQTRLPDADGIAATIGDQPIINRTYDAAGNVITITDGNGRVTKNEYDLFNRVIVSTNAEGNSTRTIYDLAGQVVAVVDALSRAAYTLYDNRGRASRMFSADPDGAGPLSPAVTKNSYDANGNLIAVTGPNGYTTELTYDKLNRLKTESSTDVQIRDDGGAGDTEFSIVSGTPGTPQTNVEGQFGRDYRTVAGTATQAPKVKWTFQNLAAGTYTVAIAWKSDVTLEQNAQVEVRVAGNLQGSTSVNQRDTLRDKYFDHQGRPLGWKLLNINVPVALSGQLVEITLTGVVGTGSIISADAVMLDRAVEKSYDYDANGNREVETDVFARQTIYVYDEVGRLIQTTLPDPDGLTGTQGPNSTNLVSPVTVTEYDGFGNVVKITEQRAAGTADDRVTLRTYDKRNRLVTETLASNDASVALFTKREYDDAGNLKRLISAHTTPIEVVTKYSYDNLNRVSIEIVDAGREPGEPFYNIRTPVKREIITSYDRVGNKTRSETIYRDPTIPSNPAVSAVSVYQYDKANRLIRQTDDFGTESHNVNAVSQFVYDAAGNLIREVDPTNRVTTYEYDRLNRRVKITSPDPDGTGSQLPPTTTIVYDVLGRVARTTNGEGESINSIYDTLGREVSKLDGKHAETRYRYDAFGNLILLVDSMNNATQFTYDRLNRAKTEVISAGTRTFIYDNAGNLAQSVNRDGKVREFTYDRLDRTTFEQWFANLAAANASSSLASGVTTLSWQYDTLGRVLLAHESIPGDFEYRESFDYDNLGRVKEARNYQGNIMPLENLNPRVRQVFQHDIIFAADPTAPIKSRVTIFKENGENGTVTSNEDFITTTSADRMGRVVKIDDSAFTSNVSTNTTGITAKTIRFRYDAAGRLLATERDAGTFHFDTIQAYDPVGRLGSLSHFKNDPTVPIVSYDYAFDRANRIVGTQTTFNTSIAAFGTATAIRTEGYVFDDAGQLTNRTSSNPSDTGDAFEYDANGNRTSANGATYAPAGPNNRLVKDGVYTYAYDNEGNRTARFIDADASGTLTPPDTAVTEYVWDHRNRLTEVKELSDTTNLVVKQTSYRYNNNDLRVEKTVRQDLGGGLVPISSEDYVYNGNNVLLTFDHVTTGGTISSAGHLKNRYLHAPAVDELLAYEDFGGRTDPGVSTYNLRWAATDHEGSVRQLLDQAHNVVEHREYDAFGNFKAVRNQSGTLESSLATLDTVYAFAGREWDNDAGLYYNRARWFDAKVGRFLSEDPLGFGGGDANLYRYAGNDPLNFTDPTGQFSLKSLIKKIGREVNRLYDQAEDFVDNFDDNLERLAHEPIFWASLAIAPFISAHITWGFFDFSFGLNGFSFGPNWFRVAGDAYSALTGGGLNFGAPTLHVSSQVFGYQSSTVLMSAPTQLIAPSITSSAMYDSNVVQASYGEEVSTGNMSRDEYFARREAEELAAGNELEADYIRQQRDYEAAIRFGTHPEHTDLGQMELMVRKNADATRRTLDAAGTIASYPQRKVLGLIGTTPEELANAAALAGGDAYVPRQLVEVAPGIFRQEMVFAPESHPNYWKYRAGTEILSDPLTYSVPGALSKVHTLRFGKGVYRLGWDSIRATQPVYPGTVLPRSFVMATESGQVWVHGNATKHMAEHAIGNLNRLVSPELVNLGTQAQLTSLHAAVQRATSQGIQYNRLLRVGGWELKFAPAQTPDTLPALIHALPK